MWTFRLSNAETGEIIIKNGAQIYLFSIYYSLAKIMKHCKYSFASRLVSECINNQEKRDMN